MGLFQLKRRAFENGALQSIDRFTGIYAVVRKPPPNRQAFEQNPLGIYVDGISWSKELG